MNAPALWIIETPQGVWATTKPEVAAKYEHRADCFVTPYFPKLPAKVSQ